MRNLRADDLDLRFREWDRRVSLENVERKKALDLYCGNSWSVIRQVAGENRTPSTLRIWVISAGHGLVAIDENLAPYAATFSPRDQDSVIPPQLPPRAVAEWWQLLVDGRRRVGTSVASISDIARLHPKTPLIAALSKDYLRAVAQDLEEARSAMVDGDRLVIVASGAEKTGPLRENFLPCDSRLEHCYGRSRMALNARILRSLVQEIPPKDIRASYLASRFGPLLARLPKATYPQRLGSDDEAVRGFIRHEIVKSAQGTYTGLLRQYRAIGRACEQKRFRRLFQEVNGRPTETYD